MSASTLPSPPICHLLRLPKELRVLIYEQLYECQSNLAPCFKNGTGCSHPFRVRLDIDVDSNEDLSLWRRYSQAMLYDSDVPIPVSILRTCKQLYLETRDILYEQTHFYFFNHIRRHPLGTAYYNGATRRELGNLRNQSFMKHAQNVHLFLAPDYSHHILASERIMYVLFAYLPNPLQNASVHIRLSEYAKVHDPSVTRAKDDENWYRFMWFVVPALPQVEVWFVQHDKERMHARPHRREDLRLGAPWTWSRPSGPWFQDVRVEFEEDDT